MSISANLLSPHDLLKNDETFVLSVPSFRQLSGVIVATENLPSDEQSMRLQFSDKAYMIVC